MHVVESSCADVGGLCSAQTSDAEALRTRAVRSCLCDACAIARLGWPPMPASRAAVGFLHGGQEARVRRPCSPSSRRRRRTSHSPLVTASGASRRPARSSLRAGGRRPLNRRQQPTRRLRRPPRLPQRQKTTGCARQWLQPPWSGPWRRLRRRHASVAPRFLRLHSQSRLRSRKRGSAVGRRSHWLQLDGGMETGDLAVPVARMRRGG